MVNVFMLMKTKRGQKRLVKLNVRFTGLSESFDIFS